MSSQVSLGHSSFPYLEHLFPHLFSHVVVSSLTCEQCIYGKYHRVSFKVSFNKSYTPFSCIYTAVWGPFFTLSVLGRKYLSFIDDYTRVSWIYLLKSKNDVINVKPQFYQVNVTQFHSIIQVFYSDNAQEFVNQSLVNFFQTQGILYCTICVHTPQQNSIAELTLSRSGSSFMFYYTCS